MMAIGISAKEFKQRRQLLAEKLPLGSMAILWGAPRKFRNHDAEFPFRQESDFYYLTGFCEPDAILVLLKLQPNEMEMILFCHPRHVEEERWVGKKAGLEEAKAEYGADKAYAITDADLFIPELIKRSQKIFCPLGHNALFEKRIEDWYLAAQPKGKIKENSELSAIFVDLLPFIHEARLIKSPAEIELMRKAAKISATAHVALMKACQPNTMEYDLEGLFLYECFKAGCRTLAYNSIVGGGVNACTLHYNANDQPLKAGDLVLIDAAAEYQYYAADITRTFPVGGKFTPDQKKLYELVLTAQLAAIEAVRPGTRWDKLQEIVVNIIVRGLLELGILKGDKETVIREKTYKKFYMHNSGHWLGLDVHDAGGYKVKDDSRTLTAGMVLTVEPGIYISPNDPNVDKRWWGIGIRIEDDVLVTATGHQVLSSDVPKTIAEIENLMNTNLNHA